MSIGSFGQGLMGYGVEFPSQKEKGAAHFQAFAHMGGYSVERWQNNFTLLVVPFRKFESGTFAQEQADCKKVRGLFPSPGKRPRTFSC